MRAMHLIVQQHMLTDGGPVDRAVASKMEDAWALIRQQVQRAQYCGYLLVL